MSKIAHSKAYSLKILMRVILLNIITRYVCCIVNFTCCLVWCILFNVLYTTGRYCIMFVIVVDGGICQYCLYEH